MQTLTTAVALAIALSVASCSSKSKQEPAVDAGAAPAPAAALGCEQAVEHVLDLALSDPAAPEPMKQQVRKDRAGMKLHAISECQKDEITPEEAACIVKIDKFFELKSCTTRKRNAMPAKPLP